MMHLENKDYYKLKELLEKIIIIAKSTDNYYGDGGVLVLAEDAIDILDGYFVYGE